MNCLRQWNVKKMTLQYLFIYFFFLPWCWENLLLLSLKKTHQWFGLFFQFEYIFFYILSINKYTTWMFIDFHQERKILIWKCSDEIGIQLIGHQILSSKCILMQFTVTIIYLILTLSSLIDICWNNSTIQISISCPIQIWYAQYVFIKAYVSVTYKKRTTYCFLFDTFSIFMH